LFNLSAASLHGSRVGVQKPENLAARVFRAFVELSSAIGLFDFY